MARRTKAEAEKTRQRILMAALDLFAAKGYERTTFEDVAERIRLTKGAVYWHFKSKPDLLLELVTHMTDKHNEELSRMLSPPDSPDGLVAHFVERARLLVNKPLNRKYFLMMLSMDWPSAKFAPIKTRLHELKSNPFNLIKDSLTAFQKRGDIRPDSDVEAVTMSLGALWLGAVKLPIDHCPETDLSTSISLGFNAIINAIRA